MPCNDVSELLRVKLDGDNRLTSYRLLKATCGGAVGAESILLERLAGQTIDQILALDLDTFLPENSTASEIEEFLNLKHFFAVRSVLQSFSGISPAGVGSACTISGISYGPDGVTIDAEIAVDVVTEQIRSCGHCAGCGHLKTRI